MRMSFDVKKKSWAVIKQKAGERQYRSETAVSYKEKKRSVVFAGVGERLWLL